MQNMFTALNNTLFSFNPEGGVTWSIAFEPLVAAMLPGVHAHKTNVLGLESAQDGFSKWAWKSIRSLWKQH